MVKCIESKAWFMRKFGLFCVSLFTCTMIFMGCCGKLTHENGQVILSTAPYGLQSHFSIPGPGFIFDVLSDGRLMGISGNELFMETGFKIREFKNCGSLSGLKSGPYGPSFLKVSPDGNRFALGNGKGQIGIYNVDDLVGNWFSMPHFDAEWADNTILVITHGEFGEPSLVSFVDLADHNTRPAILIQNIGGAPAGIAFDSQGNLFTGNGVSSQ